MTTTSNSATTTIDDTEDEAVELARPISFEARYGAGKRRAVVLGGGGVYFVAWQVAYLNGIVSRGVELRDADVIVGTSAGSVVASILSRGGLKRFGKQVDWMSRIPALVGLLAPASNLHPSQLRALHLFQEAQTAAPETVRAIGHAALAADTPTAAETRRSVGFAIASRGWPSRALHITSTDAYTGERLVITREAHISAIRAAAASSAVPGIFSPQPLHDRRGMDGGVSGTGTHCDLVAGAQRALVLSLGATVKMEAATMTIPLNSLESEMAHLDEAGTRTFVRGPSQVKIEQLMKPEAVSDALTSGDLQAQADAAELAAFWSD